MAETGIESKIEERWVIIYAYEAHILIPHGKKYEGNMDKYKEEKCNGNGQVPCLKLNKKIKIHSKIIEKHKAEYESSCNGCECYLPYRIKPFIYFNLEKHSNGSICDIKLYCEKKEELDIVLNSMKKEYKEDFGRDISFYKTDKRKKIVIRKDMYEKGEIMLKSENFLRG